MKERSPRRGVYWEIKHCTDDIKRKHTCKPIEWTANIRKQPMKKIGKAIKSNNIKEKTREKLRSSRLVNVEKYYFSSGKRNYSVPSLCTDASSFMRRGGRLYTGYVNHGFENASKCAECAMLIISLWYQKTPRRCHFGRGSVTRLAPFKVLRTTAIGIIRGYSFRGLECWEDMTYHNSAF